MKRAILSLAAVLAALTMSSAANALVMTIEENETYWLGSHPKGGAASPYYGLRLDGLKDRNQSKIYTFDFEGEGAKMMMRWKGDELRIWGTAYGGRDKGSAYGRYQGLFDIDFTYTDFDGTSALEGEGSISQLFGDKRSWDLVSESGKHSYAFRLGLNHRKVPGMSGWGWVNHCPEGQDELCGTHLYASDWLFTVKHKVPEPSSIALLGLGLIGLGIARRRQTA